MIKFPSLKKLKAILIDFDGTLADSMSLLYECYCEFLKNLGYEGSREEFNTFIGPSLLEIVQILKQKYHLKESLEELYNQYFYLIKLKYHTILNIFPGAIEFIKMAKRNGYQLAIVSSSTKSEIEKFLVKHDLLTEFNLIVSCDDVKISKPHSEIYFKALKQLNITSEEAIAIEDSFNGLKAAEGAQIATILIHAHFLTSHPQCSHWKEVLDLFCKGYLKYLIKPIPQIIMNESLQNTIPPFVKNAVFAIWDSQVQSKNLNNHKIIKVDGFLKDQLWISQVDYAFYYAQNYQSSLKSILQVKPLALSGTIHYQDEVLIGRRSSEVTNFQGFYEFPPSGSFEDIELTKHIYKELTEETYLKDVTSVQFISLIYDLEEEIYEIYVQIRVNSKGNPEETEEYSNLTWVNLEELQKAINQVNFVPLSRFIYENYLDPRP